MKFLEIRTEGDNVNFLIQSVPKYNPTKNMALFALNVDRLSWICQTMSGTVKSL